MESIEKKFKIKQILLKKIKQIGKSLINIFNEKKAIFRLSGEKIGYIVYVYDKEKKVVYVNMIKSFIEKKGNGKAMFNEFFNNFPYGTTFIINKVRIEAKCFWEKIINEIKSEIEEPKYIKSTNPSLYAYNEIKFKKVLKRKNI